MSQKTPSSQSGQFKRRTFLKQSAFVSTGLAAYTLGAKQAAAAPRDAKLISPRNPNAPRTIAEQKKVLIIGSGLAGLSAGLELAERGYEITIREATSIPGGRLHTRREQTKAGTFQVEHGLHMWFDNYHAFFDVIKRLGVAKNFRDYNEVHFQYRNYKPEVLKSAPPVYPLNMLNLLRRSPNFNVLEGAQMLGIIKDVLLYDHETNFSRLDNMSLPEWADKINMNKKFYEIFVYPAASVTLNDPSKVSAAEMAHLMHLYFTGQPRAMNRKMSTVDHETAIIGPLVKKLKNLGVNFQFSSPVPGLSIENQSAWGTTDSNETFDWLVLASHVPGSKKILANSYAADNYSQNSLAKVSERMSKLKPAPHYKILRVWFDSKPHKNRPDVIECPEHPPINLIGQFHLLEKEGIEWSKQSGGSILEFHLYNIPRWKSLDELQIWNRIRPTLLELMPEMVSANPIDFSMGSYDDFTSFEVGQASAAPSCTSATEEGIRNLLYCGDWVSLDFPAALMEKAVVSGRIAANHILLKDGVKQAAYKATSGVGPGLI
ncbi:MAG: oleate hydratase [Oligoflexales bacterium]|nr:oleate hydratase [Oligoflexales bacterium]